MIVSSTRFGSGTMRERGERHPFSTGTKSEHIDRAEVQPLHRAPWRCATSHPSRQAAAAGLQAGRQDRRGDRASWSRTCSRPCTTRPASGSPRSRSACRSASSPWTSPRRTSRRSRRSSSIRRSSGRPTRSRSTRKAACRSRNIYEEVERPARVQVNYLDLDGKPHEIEADGLLATCLQHEIDHLNGVLFIDHISKLKRDRVVKKFTKAAKRARAGGNASRRIASDAAAPRLHGHAGFRGADAARDRRRRATTIAAVYTRAPKPGGAAAWSCMPSPVEREARRLGLPVLTPASLQERGGAGGVRARTAPMPPSSSPTG